ncbi:MAG: hypothetical protein ACI4JM_09025 [Oscillospiraceae bacterium]
MSGLMKRYSAVVMSIVLTTFLAACENKNQNDMQVSETASLSDESTVASAETEVSDTTEETRISTKKSVSETTVSESSVSEISETAVEKTVSSEDENSDGDDYEYENNAAENNSNSNAGNSASADNNTPSEAEPVPETEP